MDPLNLFSQRGSWPCGADGYDFDQLIDDIQAVYWYNVQCTQRRNMPRNEPFVDGFVEDEDIVARRLFIQHMNTLSQKRNPHMATVQRNTVPPVIPKVIPTKPATKSKIILPTIPDEPVFDINRHIVLVFGVPGVGKTTLCTQTKNVLVLSFDPLRPLKGVLQRHMPSWDVFVEYVDALADAAEADKLPYKRIVVDGLDICFRQCQDSACEEIGVDHPVDAAYGKGFDRVNTNFARTIDRLLGIPDAGKWFVCHSTDKEIQKRDGRKVQATVPALKGGAERVVCGKCDIIISIDYDGEERIATVRGDETITAKACVDGRFLTTKGAQVHEIVLGSDGPAKAYERLVAAYDNKQWYSTYSACRAWQEKEAAKKVSPVPPVK